MAPNDTTVSERMGVLALCAVCCTAQVTYQRAVHSVEVGTDWQAQVCNPCLDSGLKSGVITRSTIA